jgi:hypothetical protein
VAWDQRPDRRTRRVYLHLQYSYAPPFGPALLVTEGTGPTPFGDAARLSVIWRLPDAPEGSSEPLAATEPDPGCAKTQISRKRRGIVFSWGVELGDRGARLTSPHAVGGKIVLRDSAAPQFSHGQDPELPWCQRATMVWFR